MLHNWQRMCPGGHKTNSTKLAVLQIRKVLGGFPRTSPTNMKVAVGSCLWLIPSRPGAEPDVHTNLDDVDVGVEADRDVDEAAARDGRCASEVLRIAAEVVVVVLDKSGQP